MSIITEMAYEREMIQLATAIARAAHYKQVDKLGKPYILHPLAVEELLEKPTMEESVVAILHDVIEDTPLTLEFFTKDLPWAGLHPGTPIFYSDITDALDAITKRDGETNQQYWLRVKQNPIALKVKLADIKHNTSPERMDGLPEADRLRLQEKYKEALKTLAGE